MSGFEAVGVILGALPLIIEALEVTKKTRKALDRFSRKDLYLTKYINRLGYHQTVIADAIIEVASSASLGDVSLEILRSGKANDILEAGVDKIDSVYGIDKRNALLGTLEEGQKLYQNLICSFDGLFSPDVNLLKSDPYLLRHLVKMNELAYPTWVHKRQRLRFLHRWRDIDEDLRELDEIVERLRKLADTPKNRTHIFKTAADQFQSSSTTEAYLKPFLKIQKAAVRLFTTLAKAVPGSCVLHHNHLLRIFLEAHSERFDSDDTKNPSFLLEILGRGVDPAQIAHYRGRIIVQEYSNEMRELLGGNRRVGFIPGYTHTQPRSRDTPEQVRPMEDIKTFCHSMQNDGMQTLIIHVSELDVLQSRRTEIRNGMQQQQQLTTLAEILRRSQRPTSRKSSWDLHERITLGFIISNTLLQLCCANWVPEQLNAESIQFYVESKPEFDSPPFDLGQPFFETTHPPGRVSGSSSEFAGQWTLDLAILLMELWEGKTLNQWVDENNKQDAFATHERRSIAEAWFDDMHYNMLSQYKKAAQAALDISRRGYYKWKAPDFQECFCKRVVRALDNFCKKISAR